VVFLHLLFPVLALLPVMVSLLAVVGEWDILHVIETLERVPVPELGKIETLTNKATLLRPDAKALIRGQGFGLTRSGFQDNFAPIPPHSVIRNKLSNPRIRALFPWWWWCCDDPNLVFSVVQGGNVILDNPATIQLVL